MFLKTYVFRNKTFFLLHNMGPKIFLFSIIGYILYKIKNFSDPYYLTKKKVASFIASVKHPRVCSVSIFLAGSLLLCMKFVRKSCPYKNSLSVIHFPSHHFYYIKWPEKKIFFSRKTTTTYICMIFHEKFFQCLAGAIPLFLIPQKIGQLNIQYTWRNLFPLVDRIPMSVG